MRVLQGIERRLAGAVDKTFARIFGGAVQPAEVTSALQREAATHLTRHDSRVIAPNRYIVELGPSDSAQVGGDVSRVNAAFSAMLGSHLRDQGWETFADVDVTFEQSDRLHTGQFRISSLIDPGVSRQIYDASSAAPAPAMQRQASYLAGPPPSAHGVPPYAQPGAAPQPASPSAHQPSSPYDPAHPYPAGPYPAQPYPAEYPQAQPYDPPQPYDPRPQPHAANYPAAPPPHPDPIPRLIVQDGTGRSHVLRRGSNIVGRGPDAALRLADHAVSRHHIDVYFDGRVAIVHDLGSTNGTSVNGAPIQTWQLADGDVITLGQSTVVFAGR